jgi:hypothetical protein
MEVPHRTAHIGVLIVVHAWKNVFFEGCMYFLARVAAGNVLADITMNATPVITAQHMRGLIDTAMAPHVVMEGDEVPAILNWRD